MIGPISSAHIFCEVRISSFCGWPNDDDFSSHARRRGYPEGEAKGVQSVGMPSSSATLATYRGLANSKEISMDAMQRFVWEDLKPVPPPRPVLHKPISCRKIPYNFIGKQSLRRSAVPAYMSFQRSSFSRISRTWKCKEALEVKFRPLSDTCYT